MTDFVIGAGARLSSKLHGLALLPLVLIIAGKGDKDTSLGDFVPSPSFNWLKAFAPKFQELGSAITGGILVAALVMMIAAGTFIIFAGKDEEKYQGGVRTAMNVVKGILIVILGPLLVTVIVSAVVAL